MNGNAAAGGYSFLYGGSTSGMSGLTGLSGGTNGGTPGDGHSAINPSTNSYEQYRMATGGGLATQGGPTSAQYNPNVASQQQQQQAQHHQLFLAATAAAAAANVYANHHQQHHHHHHHAPQQQQQPLPPPPPPQQHAQQQHQQQADYAALWNAQLAVADLTGPYAPLQQQQQPQQHQQASQSNNGATDLLPLTAAAAPNTALDDFILQSLQSGFDSAPSALTSPIIVSSNSLDPLPLGSDPFRLPKACKELSQPNHILNIGANNNNSTNGNNNPHGNNSNDSAHPDPDGWLNTIELSVPSISLDPLSGRDVVARLSTNLNDVVTRYIPCVDFLVQCQQDLRKGLEFNNRRGRLSARNFFASCIDPLPHTFVRKNQATMDPRALQDAVRGLEKLRQDAKQSERLGCESVKSNFLGGMKDGESWGLRKWLSRHGNALTVCTDLETILNACRTLDKAAATTQQLSALLRPAARTILRRLQGEIPPSYQAHSSAHPYLPFFHRLESALRAMSIFDPQDDDVICIDDSDDDDEPQVIEALPPIKKKPSQKRKRNAAAAAYLLDLPKPPQQKAAQLQIKRKATTQPPPQQPKVMPKAAPRITITTNYKDDDSSSGESDSDSVVEIIDVVQPIAAAAAAHPKRRPQQQKVDDEWTCSSCSTVNMASSDTCEACGEESIFHDLAHMSDLSDLFQSSKPASFDSDNGISNNSTVQQQPMWPLAPSPQDTELSEQMCDALEDLARLFANGQQDTIQPRQDHDDFFWDADEYAQALRLLATILRQPTAMHFVQPVDEDRLIQAGNHPVFSHVIKHPLCFTDIGKALLGSELQVDTSALSSIGRSSRGTKSRGHLSSRGLSTWNMWNGRDLLQAVDLVLLNSLAYGNALQLGRSSHRGLLNKLRKELWSGIKGIVGSCDRKKMPTRRSEKSGFVVYKIGEN